MYKNYIHLLSGVVLEGGVGEVEHPTPLMNVLANCCIHSAVLELFGYGSKYHRIELSQLKPNVKKSQLRIDVLKMCSIAS